MASDEGTQEPAGTSPESAEEPDRQAEERFVDDLISRGEAVEEGQELPPGATHVIVRDAQGRRIARRVRFTGA